jgi:hypothetical protein
MKMDLEQERRDHVCPSAHVSSQNIVKKSTINKVNVQKLEVTSNKLKADNLCIQIISFSKLIMIQITTVTMIMIT